eukprot:3499737-Pleurochrysis_carterae.AAC.1
MFRGCHSRGSAIQALPCTAMIKKFWLMAAFTGYSFHIRIDRESRRCIAKTTKSPMPRTTGNVRKVVYSQMRPNMPASTLKQRLGIPFEVILNASRRAELPVTTPSARGSAGDMLQLLVGHLAFF